MSLIRVILPILCIASLQAADVAALVKSALGSNIVPYAGVKPVTADFDGDGQADLAVVVDFNKQLAAWLRQGTVILNLDSPSLSPMRFDHDQHFCFGLVILNDLQVTRKTLFYGCFTGWRYHAGPLAGAKGAALDLDMDSGSVLRLYNDGTRFRTRVVQQN